jgi:tyrosyl-tRNA synthetase
MEKEIESHAVNPMDLKKRLGSEIVTLLYDEKAATAATADFERVFQRREQGIETVAQRVREQFDAPGGSPRFVDLPHGKTLLIPAASPAGIDWPEGWVRANGPGYNLSRILVDAGLVPSLSEARRLIRQGAITIDGTKVSEYLSESQLGHDSTIRVGRYRFLWIVHS